MGHGSKGLVGPLSQAVAELIAARGMKRNALAIEVDMRPSSLNAYLNGQYNLDERNPAHAKLIKRIGLAIGVEPDQFLTRAREITQMAGAQKHNPDVVRMSLHILEDATASPDAKGAAKRTLLGMLGMESLDV